MSAYEFTISLRIRHPRIDPATVTAALGIPPQHTWQAGEPRCDPAGAELLVSIYAREDFRLEFPTDAMTLLGRMHLAVALEVHPHSPLTAPVSRAN